MYELSYPVKDGAVVDWSALDLLWTLIFDHELRVDLKDVDGVAIIEAPSTTSADPASIAKAKENYAELMFETYVVERLMLLSQSACALAANGRTTGLNISLGHG